MALLLEQLRSLPGALLRIALGAFEIPMRGLQRLLGVPRIGWVFVAPNLAILGLFTFLPIAINFYYAFTGGAELLPRDRPFTGLDNLATLFDCTNHFDPSTCRKDHFWRAFYNTAWFAFLQVGLMVLFSLITALVLNRKILGRGFFRGVFFYPVLLSPVVVALIWKWVLQREGVLNAIVVATGDQRQWLNQASWAFFWSVFVSIWAHMGFYTLILLAGLQAIPADLYEAAAMDHASPWRRFARITLPLLMPNLLVVIILALIRAVQVFDEIFVLTGGGPGSATLFIVQFIYQTAFAESIRLYGIAAAASLVLAVALLVLTLIQLRISPVRGGQRRRSRCAQGVSAGRAAARGLVQLRFVAICWRASSSCSARSCGSSFRHSRPPLRNEFPPRLLPYGQSSVAVAANPDPLRSTAYSDSSTRELASSGG
jgi:alpha-1,4-digalacturonate transport system permease protein